MPLDLTNWMSRLASENKLSELSIPGTHDSGTRYPSSEPGRLMTQSRTIGEQLIDGVRFLDIRVRFINGKFILVHETTVLYEDEVRQGVDPVPLRFGAVRDICKEFLRLHPRETIIMSLKPDADPQGDLGGVTFQQRFDQYVSKDPGLWYLENRIPTLAEVRGKIVLFRRFPLDAGTTTPRGIDAFQGFPPDASGTISGPPTLVIQDQFAQSGRNTRTRDQKFAAVKELLDQAARNLDMDALYVNFVSGAGTVHTDIDDDYPAAVARDLNPRLEAYFEEPQNAQGRFGIIVTDFETASRNALIVRTNVFAGAGFWVAAKDGSVMASGVSRVYPAFGDASTGAVAIAATPDGGGYYLLGGSGKVAVYGNAPDFGDDDPRGTKAVSIAVGSDSATKGPGYWVLREDGTVGAYNVLHYGQIESTANLQAVSIAAAPDGRGYWILASNGRVHEYGSAPRLADRRNAHQVNVAIAAKPDGRGYWILSDNGAVHPFGTAVDYGHAGDGARGIAATADGLGYWILSRNGAVAARGTAPVLDFVGPREASVGIAADLFSPRAPSA